MTEETSQRATTAIEKVASGQKFVIYGVLVSVGSILLKAVTGDIAGLVLVIAGVLIYVGMFRLASGMGYSIGVKIGLAVLMVVPLLNLVTLLILSSRATKALSAAGFKIGLLGAKSPANAAEMASYSFKGWLRLGIALSVAWALTVCAVAGIALWQAGNEFDAGYRAISLEHRKTGWEPVTRARPFVSCAAVQLQPTCELSWQSVLAWLLIPLALSWLLVLAVIWAFFWIRAGFRSGGTKDH